jgi:hypothetical protein
MDAIKPTPALFMEMSSGHSKGPPLQVNVERLTKEQLANEVDTSIDAIVLTLEDCILRETDKLYLDSLDLQTSGLQSFCFHKQDARKLCIHLLYHLAHCGERVAAKIIDRLPDIMLELDIEDSARDEPSNSWQD